MVDARGGGCGSECGGQPRDQAAFQRWPLASGRHPLRRAGGDGGADTEPKAIDYVPPTGGFKHEVEPDNVDVTEKHRRNWRKCIKTRELPVSDIGIQYKTIILPIIANIAYVVGRELTFDPKTNRFINDEEANRFLSDPYREPWSLKGY